jgi:hypothetical protein
MATKRRQSRRRKQGGLGSDLAESAAKGCASGCARGCVKSLPVVLILVICSCDNTTSTVASPKDFVVRLIREYQVKISPQLHIDCFFDPSCSNYALAAINKYGLLKGLSKTMFRVAKCNSLVISQQASTIMDIP